MEFEEKSEGKAYFYKTNVEKVKEIHAIITGDLCRVVIYPHGSHLNGLMPNREREKKLYRMIPIIGLMYKTFGKYRKENMKYFGQSEKEIIDWIREDTE